MFRYSIIKLTRFVGIFCLILAHNGMALDWESTTQKVSSGVVSIKLNAPFAFDGNTNMSSEGTGFVVDAERGLILTNRHIVTPGPVTANATFLNNEELELEVVYRDPVHDFGFYRYKPSQLKHLKPYQFPLVPDAAKVGVDIRVIGNDAGEKISILSGTISRTNRQAPYYGHWKYSDFNTFYIQAATGTSGGSSGSPAINIAGEAIALNAGGDKNAQTAFLLPLQRVTRVLKLIQSEQAIPRGTLQTKFNISSYPELLRLGISEELERHYRRKFPNFDGLLTVSSIIPKTPADEKLKAGDVLLQVNNQDIVDYAELEKILDDSVSKNVSLKIHRDGSSQDITLTVDNLHSITPSNLLDIDKGSLHDLSYHQALHFNKEVSGVYVAYSPRSLKRAGVFDHAVITKFNGAEIKNVDDFIKVLSQLKRKQRVDLSFYDRSEVKKLNYASVEFDWHWFSTRSCVTENLAGAWKCKNIELSTELDDSTPKIKTYTNKRYKKKGIEAISKSLVNINFSAPHPVGNHTQEEYAGTGLVVDSKLGWIITDRTSVPHDIGDVKIKFFNQVEVSGKVVYIHPLHNLSIVSYPPEALQNHQVNSAVLLKNRLKKSDEVTTVILDGKGQIKYRQNTIDRNDALRLRTHSFPKYKDFNIETIFPESPFKARNGVLADKKGRVHAFWARFEQANSDRSGTQYVYSGIPSELIEETIQLAKGEIELRSLELELREISALNAVKRGLDDHWVGQQSKQSTEDAVFYQVARSINGSPSADIFQKGDILLSIDGQALTSFRRFEELSQKPVLQVKFFREGKVHEVQAATEQMRGRVLDEFVHWSGLYLHAPHRASRLQWNLPAQGLLGTYYFWGSPAERYGLHPGFRIVMIDTEPISDTEDFIRVIKSKRGQESMKVTMISANNSERVITLKPDEHFWPSFSIRYEDGEWQRFAL